MERSFFTSSSPGKPIRIKKNKWAFCPDPLPSTIDPDWRISATLSEAERAIGRLEGELGKDSIFSQQAQKILLFQEVSAALMFENIKVSAESHFLQPILETGEGEAPQDYISLYINAYNEGLGYLGKSLPPSLDLILIMYRHVFPGDTVPNSEPVGFREKTVENALILSCGNQELKYIPPPEAQMKTALYSLDKRFRHGGNLPDLINMSLIYYQFMAIRPLASGNMVIASLLSDLLMAPLLETKTIPLPLAPYFRANSEDFSRCFLQVVKTGDWAEWIVFFLKGITQQAIKARKAVSKAMALREDYLKRLEIERVSIALSHLAEDIFLNPFITVNHASRLTRVTFRAAQFNVDKLVALGILKETTGRKRNRVYTAPGVIELYEYI